MESLRLRLLLDAALVCMLQRLKKEHERVVSLESTDGSVGGLQSCESFFLHCEIGLDVAMRSGGAFMPQPQGQRE